MASEREFEREFRKLLVEIAHLLHEEEIQSIAFIEELPKNISGKLQVLISLQARGRITDPSSLEDLLRTMNRMDLVKRVKDFVKSQKKGNKKGSSKSTETSNSMVDLEVALAFAKLLNEHIEKAKEAAGPKSLSSMLLEAEEAAVKVEAKLKEAKAAYDQTSPDSSESEGSPSPPATLQRNNPLDQKLQQHLAAEALSKQKAPKKYSKSPPGKQTSSTDPAQPLLPPPVKKPIPVEQDDSGDYIEVGTRVSPALHPKSSQSLYYSSADLIAAETQNTATAKSNALVISALKHPLAKKSPLPPPKRDKPVPLPKPDKLKERVKSEENFLEAIREEDHTGGSSSTGDSGFSEVGEFLKRPLEKSPKETASPYCPIDQEKVQVPSYYKSADRESNNFFQELMKEEPIYQNLPQQPREK